MCVLNTWTPLMPTACIALRSFLIPSLVTWPFIQCHHVIGPYSLDGAENSVTEYVSFPDAVNDVTAAPNTAAQINVRIFIFQSVLLIS